MVPDVDSASGFSPSDLMRARRPELFSDTVQGTGEPPLERAQLEFHLDTLTQRKEEMRFEHFARLLAERELCPNLLPQTGPTGGGDSGVDSETYPVSTAIAHRWYEGDPERSSTERWAFAFSAKKRWRDKVKSDVAKIAATGRPYSLAYFITNQAVRDRDRAAVEDSLRNQLELDVRILDRTWIIEKVLGNGRWDVVYRTLDIARPAQTLMNTLGPLDTQREAELAELEAQIQDQARYAGSNYQLVEDCLQTAVLARGLGRPRVDVDGRFDRAERQARQSGGHQQLFRVLYARAWSAFWWFDDLSELDRRYAEIESLVIESESVWELERLGNLWLVGVAQCTASPAGAEWTERGTRLRESLSRRKAEDAKPTGALWAKTQLALMDLVDAVSRGASRSEALSSLSEIVGEARDHPGYPFESLTQIIQQLGQVVGDSETYDELLETVIESLATRASKTEEGRARLARGLQRLGQADHYGAISQCAKAQTLLAQEESMGEFAQALAATALGYEGVGLLWSARANLVVAADRCLYEYQKDGLIAPQAVPLLRRLVWLDMQLGRIPCVLLWLGLLDVISRAVILADAARDRLIDERLLMDAVLGLLVLRTRHEDWLELDRVPGLLASDSMPLARGAALFALGHEDAFRSESGQTDEDLDAFFASWIEQPAANDLPAEAEWHCGSSVSMRTVVAGCEIDLVAASGTQSLLWGETILAFVESFLSTILKRRGHISPRPSMRIELGPSDSVKASIEVEIEEDDCGDTTVLVTHPAVGVQELVNTPEYHDALMRLLAIVIAELHIPFSPESLEGLFSIERAQDRAGIAALSPAAVTNLLGDAPGYHIEDQIPESLTERFERLREHPWKAARQAETPEAADPSAVARERTNVSWEFGVDGLKHRDIRVATSINIPLWDRAGWCGMGLAAFGAADGPPVPALVFVFGDIDAGCKIFRGWRKRVGEADTGEWVGVTIVTGIDRSFPSHYRVMVGPNIDVLEGETSDPSFLFTGYRIQEMSPSDSSTLDQFLLLREAAGRFFIMPGTADTGAGFRASPELSVEKRRMRVVPAWRIGANDYAISALHGVFDPLIPSDVHDPPVLRALEQLSGLPGHAGDT